MCKARRRWGRSMCRILREIFYALTQWNKPLNAPIIACALPRPTEVNTNQSYFAIARILGTLLGCIVAWCDVPKRTIVKQGGKARGMPRRISFVQAKRV